MTVPAFLATAGTRKGVHAVTAMRISLEQKESQLHRHRGGRARPGGCSACCRGCSRVAIFASVIGAWALVMALSHGLVLLDHLRPKGLGDAWSREGAAVGRRQPALSARGPPCPHLAQGGRNGHSPAMFPRLCDDGNLTAWTVGMPPPRCWQRPEVRGEALPRNTTAWDVTTDAGRRARRDCVQRHLFAAQGLDTLREYFVPGCDVPPMRDFEAWAEGTGCGTEPVEGRLLVHTAWSGPHEHVREDLDALVDSFLATQDLARSRLVFWFLDEPVNASAPFVRKYSGAKSHGAVEFQSARLATFARGTVLEGRADVVDVDWSKVKKGPRWKANLFRILVLHKHGGVWVDTDSVLLRDLRPLVEFAGELATKLTMSLYYNNNVMALRQGSPLSASMLADVAATPLGADSKRYCRHVGQPCYPKWTWNHGIVQLAVRHRRGIVIVPTTYTDPAYGCFPQWLLGASGGQPTRAFTVRETLEFIRGAFVLHTRAYKAAKPMNPGSNYGRLYRLAAEVAASAGVRPVPLVGVTPRNASEAAFMRRLFERRGERDNVVDPPFLPRSPRRAVVLRSSRLGTCLNAVRHVKGEMYGGNPELEATADCAKARRSFNETVVFLWHEAQGYLRPAHREPGRVLCVDALTLSVNSPSGGRSSSRGGGVGGGWSARAKMITCNPDRPTQQWVFTSSGALANPPTALCAEADAGGGGGRPEEGAGAVPVVMRACSASSGLQRWEMIPVGDLPYY